MLGEKIGDTADILKAEYHNYSNLDLAKERK